MSSLTSNPEPRLSVQPERAASSSIWAAELTVLALLCIAALAQCAAFWSCKSPTFDETYVLNCALQTVYERSMDVRLARNGTAPVGALIGALPPAIAVGGEPREDEWLGLSKDVRAVTAARVIHALLTVVPLILMAHFWLRHRHGWTAGLTGASLVAFSPALIGNSSLATTDALFATTAVGALLVISRHRMARSWKTSLAVVVAIAFAISTKYSGVFLLPVTVLCFVIDRFRQRGEESWLACAVSAAPGWIAKTIGLTAAVFVVAWLLHGFNLVSLPGRSVAETPPFLRPGPIFGIAVQAMHNAKGHHAYLMGEFSLEGWWYYFPVALALKSTPSELFMLIVLTPLAAFACLAGVRRSDVASQTIVLGLIVMLVLAMRANINIGYRYLLGLYPLGVIVAIDHLFHWLPARSTQLKFGCVLLVVVQFSSAISIAPHYLAYFTPLVGGPSRGGEYLIDSNLDWGQDLPLLKQELDRLGHQRVLLQYFGTAEPRAYGLEYAWLHDVPPKEWGDFDAVAVSETFMRGGYGYGRDPFEQLRSRAPQARAGYSIRIYDLADKQVRDDLEQAWSRELPRVQR